MAIEAATIDYELTAWLQAIRDDTRLSVDVKDLAYQMAIAANPAGFCSATNPQLRQHLRGDNGNLVPDTTLRNRRRKLVGFGYMELYRPGGVGVGRGYGSVYRLLLPVELRPKKWVRKASKATPEKRPPDGRHAHTNGTQLLDADSMAKAVEHQDEGRGLKDSGATVEPAAVYAPYDPLAELLAGWSKPEQTP